ncbi:hypothetical protein AGABI2DRAFT_200508, partial [Agaricus bisporus var. bisporus H97]|uniref:hypothetical protein n=1 Tax=Agaricus bisporus var. bisporus (strain H97 / ATCC MYA-4626 / FGSC 10389) TaxID=936046 RepID=UPI00029F72C1
MGHLLCIICDKVDKPDEFLAQYCGHAFCKHCISQLSTCPKCRTEWGSRIPYRIFFDFPDASVVSRLYSRLENMGEETPPVVADKTSGIIRKFVEDSSLAHDASQASSTQVALLEATERLEKRVIPLFSDLERMRKENSSLREQSAADQLDIQSKEGLSAQIEE